MPSQVPQFVLFGSDDNYYADGVTWLVNSLFSGRKNPDGSPTQITFFITAGYGTSQNGGVFVNAGGFQTEQDVVNSWKAAYAAGHEIGNHTWDHLPNHGGLSLSLADWQPEISKSQNFLINQVGVPACALDGWRFPYLEFDDAGFQAYQAAGFLFDTSVEFGYNWWQPPGSTVGYGPGTPESGKHYWWPFTLDGGFPSNGFDPTETKGVQAHTGTWEFLENVFNSPDPGSADWMNPTAVRTVTGLDYNLWVRIATIGAGYDFCQTLEYTFLQKYNGNRSPFNVGIHSHIYSPDDPSLDTSFGNTSDQRRAALKCFVDFLLSGPFPDVRVVGFHKVIAWMRAPTPLR